MSRIVVGLYDNFEDARATVKDLVDNGFDRNDVSLVASDAKGEFTRQINSQGEVSDEKKPVAKDAGIGAVIGGLGGLLLGLGALAIPGIGPVIAAGPIAGLIGGGAVGAAAGGLVGALTKSGVPEEHAREYAEGVRRGGTLVTVNSPENMVQQAVDIMNSHNPVDVTKRSQQWKQNKWTGFNEKAQPMTHDEIQRDRLNYQQTLDRTGETTIPVIEEELRAGKRQVETGGVRIHTNVEETPVDETVNLRQEHVNVERTPVDRPASPEDIDNAFQEGTMEVTETGEEVVTDKTARVVEEVHVNKDVEDQQQNVHDTVRRTNVDVEDLSGKDVNRRTRTDRMDTSTEGYEEFEPMWRNHYNSYYGGNTTYTFEQFRPYYEYGYDMANSNQFQDYEWNQAQPAIQDQWVREYPDLSWNDYQDAVHQGWNAARGQM